MQQYCPGWPLKESQGQEGWAHGEVEMRETTGDHVGIGQSRASSLNGDSSHGLEGNRRAVTHRTLIGMESDFQHANASAMSSEATVRALISARRLEMRNIGELTEDECSCGTGTMIGTDRW